MKISFPLMMFILAVLVGCPPGGTLYIPPVEDPCFDGSYTGESFSIVMYYQSGHVDTSATRTSTEAVPWEGMNFMGKIMETGRAEGTLTLNFPDDSFQVFSEYSIYLEPSLGNCSERRQLRFEARDYYYNHENKIFGYTLTRQP